MELLKYLRTQWDRTGAVLATLIGALILILGYIGTAGTEYIAEQIPYLISGGLFGIFFLSIGAVLWISADLRDEWREMNEQGEAIRREQLERRVDLTAFIQAEIARHLAAADVSPVVGKGTSRRPAVRAGANGANADAARLP